MNELLIRVQTYINYEEKRLEAETVKNKQPHKLSVTNTVMMTRKEMGTVHK